MPDLPRKPNRRAGFTARLITVTDGHVRDGDRADCYGCAVHLAIQEHTRDDDFHLVDTEVTWQWFGPVLRSKLPRSATRLIQRIDGQRSVLDDLRCFWLQIPTELLRPAAPDGGPGERHDPRDIAILGGDPSL